MHICQIAWTNYNKTVNGLSGVCVTIALWIVPLFTVQCIQNEDCGQMSAWYIYSALGFYPVNPVSGEYVIRKCVLIEYYLGVAVANIVPV